MKHYILLSVEVPEFSNDQAGQNWRTLEEHLESLNKTTKGIERLGRGVWLLPRDSGIYFAAECISLARAKRLKVSARFVSEEGEL